MARADRLERLDARREELEAHYRAMLTDSLHVTAGGKWGLFGHKADRADRARVEPVLARLRELADDIDALRHQLGLSDFALHREFLAARGPARPDAAGEPKQARAWLEKLESA